MGDGDAKTKTQKKKRRRVRIGARLSAFFFPLAAAGAPRKVYPYRGEAGAEPGAARARARAAPAETSLFRREGGGGKTPRIPRPSRAARRVKRGSIDRLSTLMYFSRWCLGFCSPQTWGLPNSAVWTPELLSFGDIDVGRVWLARARARAGVDKARGAGAARHTARRPGRCGRGRRARGSRAARRAGAEE